MFKEILFWTVVGLLITMAVVAGVMALGSWGYHQPFPSW